MISLEQMVEAESMVKIVFYNLKHIMSIFGFNLLMSIIRDFLLKISTKNTPKSTQINYFYIFREQILNLCPKPENQILLKIV
jgi:type IV secretory pathway VirB10-like protein